VAQAVTGPRPLGPGLFLARPDGLLFVPGAVAVTPGAVRQLDAILGRVAAANPLDGHPATPHNEPTARQPPTEGPPT
jgi:hypothetical protein